MGQSSVGSILFHLAFPVSNIPATQAYYADGLGCGVGRQSDRSIILDLYGHQLVAHVTSDPLTPQRGIYPRHFGLVFTAESDWQALCDRAQQRRLKFYHPPRTRFSDSPLEHRTFFLEDPFYNLMEFKYYCHTEAIFGHSQCTQIGDVASV